ILSRRSSMQTLAPSMQRELTERRRWYAEDLLMRAPVRRHRVIVEAFATVPRERFLRPGPWRVLHEGRVNCPCGTPDDDPRWLCHNVLVTIDEARSLNNGQPSLWARCFDYLDWKRCRWDFDHLDWKHCCRVMQVGAGTGYYAAVLAEIVGPGGRVIAVECDGELAAKACDNLRPWPQVEVVHGAGRKHDPGEVDAIIVFAGSTHPAPLWLDRLAAGGQLLMPLTSENWWGFMLRVTRHYDCDWSLIVLPAARDHDRFDAVSIGPIGIFPCVGGRD